MTIAIILLVVGSICFILAEFLFGILTWLLGLLTSITGSSLFSIPAVRSIFNLMSIWSGIIIGITILMAVIKLMLEISEGKNVSVGANLRAMIIGSVLAVYGFDLGKAIFFLGELIRTELVSKVDLNAFTLKTAFSNSLISSISSITNSVTLDSSKGGLDAVSFSKAFTDFFSILVIAVFIYQIFKLLTETFERTMMYFFTLVQMPLYVSMYINGNDQALSTWFKQLAGIMFGLALRYLGVNLAFYILLSTTPTFGALNLFAVMGILMATGKADQTLQSFGASSGWGGSGRMISSTVSGSAHMASHVKALVTK